MGPNSQCAAANKVLKQKNPSSACNMYIQISHGETDLGKPRIPRERWAVMNPYTYQSHRDASSSSSHSEFSSLHLTAGLIVLHGPV